MEEKGQLETDEEPRVWTEGFQEGLDPTPTSPQTQSQSTPSGLLY